MEKVSFTTEVKEETYDVFLNDEKKTFLQRVFLESGSITDPTHEYHLEITTDNLEMTKKIISVLKEFRINAKYIEKKYRYVVYVKEAESIALFLNIIGAHNALFKFEDAKVLHEMNNNINRLVNCETANISKVVETALRQIEIINLPENLREIAEVRCENPEASLKELGEKLKSPIGKSGVNYRLKKIEEIYNKMQ